MRWKTERTDEFKKWWETLTELEQSEALTSIEVLEESGPTLGRPTVDSVKGSRHPNLKEMRANRTIRIFFAFDPRRVAALLIGGDKAGRTKRFYRNMIPEADKIYDAHLKRIRKGKAEDGQR